MSDDLLQSINNLALLEVSSGAVGTQTGYLRVTRLGTDFGILDY